MSEEEISLDQFELLSEEKEDTIVSQEEVLEALEGVAKTSSKLQEELNVNKYPTMYGALERMVKRGQLIKRYEGKRVFYSKNPDFVEDAEE